MALSKDTIASSESLADFPFEQVIGSGGLAIVWKFCFFFLKKNENMNLITNWTVRYLNSFLQVLTVAVVKGHRGRFQERT